MSIRDDVQLSGEERQALAKLAARLEAEDPRFAATFRRRNPLMPVIAWLQAHTRPWWGPTAIIVGAVLMILSLSSTAGLYLGIAAALLTASGLGQVTAVIGDHLRSEALSPPTN
ncbi:MAG: DUF3040 domain-containing protein [Actinomycetota bacterium]|nr:DUF3040 domain-containing protein [Actinomycetota bacterium]